MDKVPIEQFLNIKNAEIAYFLGFLWADGCVGDYRKKKHYVQITINNEDFKNLHVVFNNIGNWNVYEYKPRKGKLLKTINIWDRKLARFLQRLDYCSKAKSPTKVLKIIPSSLKRYFYRGIIDGDGCIAIAKDGAARICITGPFNQNWKYVFEICKKLKIIPKVSLRKFKNSRWSMIYFGKRKFVLDFCRFIYQGYPNDAIGLKRKYQKYQRILTKYE